MKKPKRVRVNYRLRPEVKADVEQIATDTGKTMTEVIEEAVNLYADLWFIRPSDGSDKWQTFKDTRHNPAE